MEGTLNGIILAEKTCYSNLWKKGSLTELKKIGRKKFLE
jgi:hypothetical protein